jgi:hypothetical protein
MVSGCRVKEVARYTDVIKTLATVFCGGVAVTKKKVKYDTAAKFYAYNGSHEVLIGARIRTYAVSALSAMEVKLTHSDRVHGEASEFERMRDGKMDYFIQMYKDAYVLVDVNKMRALDMFKTPVYETVDGNSNGGAYRLAEFKLQKLFDAGVIVNASPKVKAYFTV